MENRPVILGSSLTGLLISHSLSEQNISHILIGGDCPRVEPRLGESMNEGASLNLWRTLGFKYRKHFFPKSHISLCNGRFATMLKTGTPNRCFDKLALKLSDQSIKSGLNQVLSSLSHLNRSEFDAEFYEDTIAKRRCQFVRCTDAKVFVDSDTDQVVKIKGGKHVWELPPFVFDATGPRGVVAKAAEVETEFLTQKQRVIWTHLLADQAPDHRSLWWLNGTNLVRLDKVQDLVDGIAWAIPMGNRLSIGLSVEADCYPDERLNVDDLLARLIWAFERRGIEVSTLFPERDRVFDITHRYFKRSRAYGRNWFLAGGTYQQVWFPTSSGVSTSTLAAKLAPQLLQDVDRWGSYYEHKMATFMPFHDFLSDMIAGQPWQATATGFHFWADWTAGSFKRVASDLQLENDEPDSGRLRYSLLKNLGMAMGRNRTFQFMSLGFAYSRVKAVQNLAESSNALNRLYFSPTLSKATDALTSWPRYWFSLASLMLQPRKSDREVVTQLRIPTTQQPKVPVKRAA